MAEHEVDITYDEDQPETSAYGAVCSCGDWHKEGLVSEQLAKAHGQRHLLIQEKWPYEDEAPPENWPGEAIEKG